MDSNVIDWIEQGDGEIVTFTMKFPDNYWPVTIDTDAPWEKGWKTSLPADIELWHLWTFVGLDQGDHAETDIEIYAQEDGEDAFPLVLRSLHRHDDMSFESWQRRVFLHKGIIIRHLRVFMRGRKMPDMKSIRVHFGVKIMGVAL